METITMQQITKDEFFSIIGPMDVVLSNRESGRYDNEWGYTTFYKTRSGRVIGKSDGGTHLQESRFFLSGDLVKVGNANDK